MIELRKDKEEYTVSYGKFSVSLDVDFKRGTYDITGPKPQFSFISQTREGIGSYVADLIVFAHKAAKKILDGDIERTNYGRVMESVGTGKGDVL